MEKLTSKEQSAQKSFLSKLNINKRKTKNPVIVAFIGLVGSGKSSVARELAKHIGATVISGDDIRIELRKQNEKYGHTRAIAENVALEIMKKGDNVVVDSDFVDEKKRASIREKARKAQSHLIFIRTYCDLDVVVGRIITANYKNSADDFFGGASSGWKGNKQTKGAVVKIREMWRRTPHHYKWVNKIGGKWVLRKFSFSIFAEIDTTNKEVWKHKIEGLAKKLF